MRPPLPSLQSLRALEAAARYSSYSRAAEDLCLTHGAVSRQISALEAWTGTQLFVREKNKMIPTADALQILSRTRTALDILSQSFGHPVATKPEQGLSLTTTQAIARYVLLPHLNRLPTELLSSVHASSDLSRLDNNNIDAAIRYGEGSWDGHESAHLGDEQLVPVAHPNFANAVRSDSDILKLPLLSTSFQSWSPWLEAAGIAPQDSIPMRLLLSDMSLLLDAAIAGHGVALAAERLVTAKLDEGSLVKLSGVAVPDTYGYYLVWQAGSPKGEKIDRLKKSLISIFKDLA